MISYEKGDIFESGADCIFNTVNCEGYMGKGIAYQFKTRFPDNNKKYVEECKKGHLKPGIILSFYEKGITIINFPTKDKWRQPSRISYIEDGLKAFVKILPELNVSKIAIPPLGCGNGGLDWNDVKQLIEKELSDCDIDIVLYEPGIIIKQQSTEHFDMTVNDLLLLYIKRNLKNATSLRFQKTMFFTNYYFGRNIYGFSRGRYGPYSKDLYQEAEKIGKYQKQNNIKTSEETHDAVYRVICSKKVDKQYEDLTDAAKKALEIVNSVDNDKLLEGSATVMYLIKDEKILNQSDIIHSFIEWSEDKAARFDKDAILDSMEFLEAKGIITGDLFHNYELNKV